MGSSNKSKKGMMPIFYTVCILFWFAQYIYTPFLSAYLSMIGVGVSMIGMIIGSYGVLQMITRTPISIFDTQVRDHRIIIGGGLISVIIACITPVFSESAIGFLVCRTFAGLASATWVSYSAFLLEGGGKDINKRMGKMLTASTAGVLIAQFVGTLIYNKNNMEVLFIIGIASAVAAFLLFLTIANDPSMHPKYLKSKTKKGAKRGAIRSPQLICCCILGLLMQIILFGTNLSFVAVYAQDMLNASTRQIGFIAILCQLSGLAMSTIFSKIGSKPLPEKAIVVGAFVTYIIYCLLIAIVQSTIIMVLLQILCGFSMGTLNVVLMANAGRGLKVTQQAFANGVLQSFNGMGITFGPVIAASIYRLTNNYQYTFVIMAFVGLLAVIVAAVGYRNPRRWIKYRNADRLNF